MHKKIKSLLIVFLLIAVTTISVQAIETKSRKNAMNNENNSNDNFSYIENQFLSSSRFTQKENISSQRLANYYDNYQIEYDHEKLDLLGYEKSLENEKYILYFENNSYSIVLVDKTNGFTWSSRAEFQDMSDGNNAARNLMNSGIWIDYIRSNVVNYRQVTESLYSQANVSYYGADEIDPRLRPYKIKDNSYNKNNVTVTSKSLNNKIVSNINFKTLKISFDIELSLSENGVNVKINNDSITEGIETIKLTNIYVFPYLGSTREDNVPGYFVIPDAMGALVRLNKEYDKNFNGKYFGEDASYNDNYIVELSLPFFGVVHLEGEHAMYASIKEGAENVVLQGRFWGSNSKYFRMTSRYSVRQVYKQINDREGNGFDSILDQFFSSNYEVEYSFLEQEQASYVGIALDYQQKLVESGILTKREKAVDSIPINTEYIMSERENSFLGTKKITMSTIEQIEEMYTFFKEQGITNQQLNLMGYSVDGNYDRAPYRISLVENKKHFKELSELVSSDNNTIYFENGYSISSALNGRINYQRDVARNVSRIRLTRNTRDLNRNLYKMYFMYPDVLDKYYLKDSKNIEALGINGVTLGDDVSTLYSYFKNDKFFDRTNNIDYLLKLYESFSKTVMRHPNLYALKYAETYLDVPVTNSQFDFYTDLVPIIPLILKGYVSYFTPNLNFNALGKERILMMVDFAMNPSYMLTYSETYKMRHTGSSVFFSTTYNEYKDEIVSTYDYVNTALKEVIGATITNREVLDLGIVLVTYSNNVKIYVNYSNRDYIHNGNTVKATDYKVVKL